MANVSAEALSKVPYLRPYDDGRSINLSPLWDGEKWQFWIPVGDDLLPIALGDCVQIGYFAKEPANPHDLHLPFLDFLWKRASWPDLTRWLSSIESNIDKFAASLAKLDHFATCESVATCDTSMFVVTEIEYLFGRCRSAFDDLQQVITALWNHVEPTEAAARAAKTKLPDSFRKVAQRVRDMKEGDPPPFGLPKAVLACYARINDFFFSLRDMRDKLTHRGGSVGTIFKTDKGHSVLRASKFAGLGPASEQTTAERLVSIRPILANLVCRTVYAMNDFQRGFASVITFPESMMPDHTYFLRTPHSTALTAAQALLRSDAQPGDGASS